MSESSNILKPGENITPVIDISKSKLLVEKLYGLKCKDIKELNAYDDKNFKITVEEKCDNKFINEVCPDGYVLKIMNKLDSQKTAFLEAQTDMMLFLGKNKIKCPKPVLNNYGKYYSLETLENGAEHVVRLLEFIPGKILHEVPSTPELFYDVGKYLANIDLVLENFTHEVYDTHRTLWMLECVPDLRKFVFVVTDEVDKSIVNEVIDEFERTVLPRTKQLKKTILHGDFNEQNIVVKESGSAWKVEAVLDFGDTQYSYPIFELAVTAMHMILQSKDLYMVAHVIAGYNKVKPITDEEFQLLKVCISARLCQSVVMGKYSHMQRPDNQYVLTTQAIGWEMLRKIWRMPQEELYEKWRSILRSYNDGKSA